MEKKKISVKIEQNKDSSKKDDAVITSKNTIPTDKVGKLFVVVRWISKFFKFCRHWLKKHFSEFIVTMLGVWAAFWLAGYGDQEAMDKATRQRLYLAGFEATINSEIAKEIKEIIDNKGDPNHIRINVMQFNATAALTALQDANLLSILSGEKAILLVSYVKEVQTCNQSLLTYQQTLESQDFKNTNPVNGMRKLVLYNVDAICAMFDLLQETVKELFNEELYDIQNINNMKKRLTEIREKYPKDEKISVSLED